MKHSPSQFISTFFWIYSNYLYTPTVIEVSCGEYGDNVRKLVAAIKNGKNDIRVGKPFPEIEASNTLNNANAKVNNDIAAGERKMSNGTTGVNNMLLAATNDIAKENANCEYCICFNEYFLLCVHRSFLWTIYLLNY